MKRILMGAVGLAILAGGCFVAIAPDGSLAVGVAVQPGLSYYGSSVAVVNANLGYDVYYHGGAYWRWHNGRWWRSGYYNRGWIHAAPPVAFINLPSSHPAYRYRIHHPSYRRPVIKHTRPISKPPTRRGIKPRPPIRKPGLPTRVRPAPKKPAPKSRSAPKKPEKKPKKKLRK